MWGRRPTAADLERAQVAEVIRTGQAVYDVAWSSSVKTELRSLRA
jgi:hypothetical protein